MTFNQINWLANGFCAHLHWFKQLSKLYYELLLIEKTANQLDNKQTTWHSR